MIKKAYVSKSFYSLGDSKKKCYDCKYCRILDEKDLDISYNVLPTEINPILTNVPIAVNLFYGDPMLQIDNTINYLRKLEEVKHKGAIVIITKGDFRLFPDLKFDLDLHFAFSTFGVDSEFDGGRWDRFYNNLKSIKDRKNTYKYSIEFRPVIYGVNDSYETIERVVATAKEFNLAIGYSGLQGKPDIVKYWEENNIQLKPYPGFTFGHKKSVSNEVENIFQELSEKYNVPIFRKTSCLISYVHGYNRDYNSHYYRPSEMNCKQCVMKDKCFKFKEENDKLKSIEINIPFDYTIEYKTKHECVLKKLNICEFPTPDCSNIQGNVIKIDEKISTADVRVIKWLTGMTVDADFRESPFLSDKWDKNYKEEIKEKVDKKKCNRDCLKCNIHHE